MNALSIRASWDIKKSESGITCVAVIKHVDHSRYSSSVIRNVATRFDLSITCLWIWSLSVWHTSHYRQHAAFIFYPSSPSPFSLWNHFREYSSFIFLSVCLLTNFLLEANREAETVNVRAVDGVEAEVTQANVADLMDCRFVEFIGTVLNQSTLKAESYTKIGDKFGK